MFFVSTRLNTFKKKSYMSYFNLGKIIEKVQQKILQWYC